MSALAWSAEGEQINLLPPSTQVKIVTEDVEQNSKHHQHHPGKDKCAAFENGRASTERVKVSQTFLQPLFTRLPAKPRAKPHQPASSLYSQSGNTVEDVLT
ncbi:hypothetical protein GH733_002924 [Mirounga leonina]|nr:hypothetical protein GH733_002924 [Mirounga leonina]